MAFFFYLRWHKDTSGLCGESKKGFAFSSGAVKFRDRKDGTGGKRSAFRAHLACDRGLLAAVLEIYYNRDI